MISSLARQARFLVAAPGLPFPGLPMNGKGLVRHFGGVSGTMRLAQANFIHKADGQSDVDGSRYENYHEAASIYDGIRHAGGSEVILGAFAAGPTGLNKQHVLDMGCGTGNYSAAIVNAVGNLTCMDGNASMLAKCEKKLKASGHHEATFVQGLLPKLPFADESFDGITCNLVIHHIESDETRTEWSNTAALCKEAHRVLKPGGKLIFNHITPDQVDAYWFLGYVPECRERWRSTLVPEDTLANLMTDAGLRDVKRTVPMDYVLFRPMDVYLDPKGPLDPNWRKSTSMWAVGEADELAVAMRRVEADNTRGDTLIQDISEARRKDIGHTSFIYATK